MAGDEIHDLLVKVRPDTGDTEQELDNVTEKFEETADETGRTAGMISDLSERLQGVAGIVVGTLVTLAAGLATQVPVIGETVSALGGIITALALKVDEDLRPSLSRFNRELFAIQDRMLRSENSLDALAIAVGGVTAAWDLLVPLSPLRLAIRLRAAINDMEEFGSRLVTIAQQKLAEWGAEIQLKLVDVQAGFEEFFAKVRVGIQTFFSLLINEAKRWGNAFAGVIESAVNAAIQAVPSPIRDALNLGPVSIAQPFETRSRRAIMNEGRRRLLNQRRAISERRSERRGGVQEQLARTLQALQNTTVVHETNLDGRQVAGSAADFLGEGTANIGRVNRSR